MTRAIFLCYAAASTLHVPFPIDFGCVIILPSTYDGKIQWSTLGIENVADFCHFVTCLNWVTFYPYMRLLDLSGVTGGGLDPYNVRALFGNMDNMSTERFG